MVKKPEIFRNLGDNNATSDGGSEEDLVSAQAESMCFAPPYHGEALECVDLSDPAQLRVMPLEVDEDCAMLKGWVMYLEPKSPGCTTGVCDPAIGYSTMIRNDTRVNVAPNSNLSTAAVSSQAGAIMMTRKAILLLVATEFFSFFFAGAI